MSAVASARIQRFMREVLDMTSLPLHHFPPHYKPPDKGKIGARAEHSRGQDTQRREPPTLGKMAKSRPLA